MEKDLPKVGGLFVDEDFVNRAEHIETARYYLAETPDEDDDMENEYKTWLEYPTLGRLLRIKTTITQQLGKIAVASGRILPRKR
ncbi:hypothetical protein [Serratia quinivorans]|uniref:hypothetical protein n=1 Tax=Serratia quinivorans TaxID=137545 RepID=UPI003F9D20EF